MKRLLADLFSRRASNNPLFVALLAASVTLAACGGGGGDDNGSNQPVSNVAPDKPTAASGTPASTPSAASAPAAASAPSPASTPASNGAPSSVNTPSAASAPAAASAPSAASSPSASTPASETGTSGSGNAGSANSTDTPSTPTVASNTAPIVIDGTLSNVNQLVNMPYVSVTFCVPGKQGASQCASVDHMLLDTGSVGVRVISAALGAALGAKLPAQTGASNDPTGTAAIAQCALFASGYTWGSTRRADVTIGEKTASGIPIQLIGDSGFTWTPSDCSSRGGPGMNDVAHLGANGIVGIGNLARDYPGAANAPLAANYYYCPTPWSCTAASVPLNKQTANPVAAFATDNNGTIIRLPAVPPTGLASVTGELVFGIGTRENNALPATPTLVVVTDDRGGFTTNYRGRTVSSYRR